MITKIISGAQTGADLGGLLAAEFLGIETGGWVPKGCRTENGSSYELVSRFNLKETRQSGYATRTRLNVKDSDGTLIMASNPQSPGTRQTIRFCQLEGKPYIVNPTPEELHMWIDRHDIHTLNVAGNRESKAPGLQDIVRTFLINTLSLDSRLFVK